jgi:hypothetical protein
LLPFIDIDLQINAVVVLVKYRVGDCREIDIPFPAVDAAKFLQAFGNFLATKDFTSLYEENITQLWF